MQEIETTALNLIFEPFRMRDKHREQVLCVSIAKQGIRDALLCVGSSSDSLILLDGFKRLRCARRLKIPSVPVECIGEDAALGMVQFLRRSNGSSLHYLEEASLVDQLHNAYEMSLSEISNHLERSKSWVSLRIGVLETMGDRIREEVFSGRFSARAYLYILKPFTRVNHISRKEVEDFVLAISGKALTFKEIESLAALYFRGGTEVKEQIKKGQLEWTLKQLKAENIQTFSVKSPFNECEEKTLNLLEQTTRLLRRMPHDLENQKLKTPLFWLETKKHADSIFPLLPSFTKCMEEIKNG